MSYLSWHYGVPKGSKYWSKTLDLSSGGRPNVRGQFQPLLVVPSLKLGFGTCVPRPAAPVRVVTVAMCQMTSIVEGAGLALRVGGPVLYRSREEREDKPLSPPLPAIADLYLIPVTLALCIVGRPLVVVPMGVVCFCVSRALL